MTNEHASLFPLRDLTEAPAIGSAERNAYEEAALALGCELLHQENGSIRDALYALEQAIRGPGGRETVPVLRATRSYARDLVDHVEQCWATAVLR